MNTEFLSIIYFPSLSKVKKNLKGRTMAKTELLNSIMIFLCFNPLLVSTFDKMQVAFVFETPQSVLPKDCLAKNRRWLVSLTLHYMARPLFSSAIGKKHWYLPIKRNKSLMPEELQVQKICFLSVDHFWILRGFFLFSYVNIKFLSSLHA